MDTTDAHPITKHEIHVFERVKDTGAGTAVIARFWPYDAYPVFFVGDFVSEARAAAEAFRTKVIEEHEAEYLARVTAAAKRAEAKAAKAETREVA